MTRDAFAIPAELEPNLLRVMTYWRGLVRGYAGMPYWDDFKPAALAELRHDAILADAFPDPPRYRFRLVGENVTRRYGQEIEGKFHDEIAPRPPLDRFGAQCDATVKALRPTHYRHEAAEPGGYARLVLPMWGNGRVEMLLAAIT